jgi:CBS domain-containing protein
MAFGSEGRLEQTLLTDQDNALVYADDRPDARAYFSRLAARVVTLLIDAGIPPCPGGFMATSWCRPLDSWVATFRGWIDTPGPQALMDAMSLFDFRAVQGALQLAPLEDLRRAAGREQVFLAHFARASMGLTAPLGAFRHVKREHGGVDLKKGGLAPIVGLARLAALEAGSPARPTLDRLDAAARAGVLSADGTATLAEAFRFLLELRLREQLRALRAGEPPGHTVALEHLTSLDRRHLKDVFVAIREHQQAAALRHATAHLA